MITDFFSATLDNLMALFGISVMIAAAIFAAGLLVGILFRTGTCRFVAGLMLKAVKPFQLGDTISGSGMTGTVASIRWFNTQLVMPDQTTILVPNIDLMGITIVNHTANGTRRIDIRFGVANGGDIEAAIDIIEELLLKDPRVLADPSCRIAITGYCADGVILDVQLWVSVEDYWKARSETMVCVRNMFEAEGIRINWRLGQAYGCLRERANDPACSLNSRPDRS